MFNETMQFDLGDEVNALRDMVHRWAQERVKPLAAEIDQTNDFPAIMGVTILYALTYILLNLMVDLIYYWIDPRIKTPGISR